MNEEEDKRVDWMPRHELEEEVTRLRADRVDRQVREFHRLMGIEDRKTLGVPAPDVVRLRMRLVLEETFEFLAACAGGEAGEDLLRITRIELPKLFAATGSDEPLEPDLVAVADALADLDYVVAGSRLAFGIDGVPVAREVHRSNMTKAPGGVVRRDAGGKVVKPDGWTPPDVAGVLDRQRRREEGGT